MLLTNSSCLRMNVFSLHFCGMHNEILLISTHFFHFIPFSSSLSPERISFHKLRIAKSDTTYKLDRKETKDFQNNHVKVNDQPYIINLAKEMTLYISKVEENNQQTGRILPDYPAIWQSKDWNAAPKLPKSYFQWQSTHVMLSVEIVQLLEPIYSTTSLSIS